MEVTRIFDLLERLKEVNKDGTIFTAKENGKWVNCSSQEFIENSYNVSYGLMKMGIGGGDKIATITNNRPEWNFVDMAMLQIGAVHVPMYPTISEVDFKYIFNDAEVKIVFVSDEILLQKVKNVLKDCPTIKAVYTFNKIEGANHWTEVNDLGKNNVDLERLTNIRETIRGNDMATIIYTSGTTGIPKGVMLSHGNILSNIHACDTLVPVKANERVLSFLPINHIFERTVVYMYLYLGATVCYAESIDKMGDNIRELKPYFFSAVPRLIEKVYAAIINKGKELKGVKKMLFFWAIDLGLEYEFDGANGWWYETQLKLANKLVFSKWRDALGGNIRAIVTGSAAVQPRLQRIFWAAGIPLLEGYGLTETSPVIAVNTLDNGDSRFGTVGKVIKDVEVKIADDGEILVKGPNVMLGYYKKQQLTNEAIDTANYFHTGDIGMFDGKFLKITDRKKEIFKTSGGKYIAPQMIENKFKESPFIEQVMVIGENRRFPAAFIVPNFGYLRNYCKMHGINATTNEELVNNKAIINKINEEVTKLNESLAHYEQIKKIELLPKEWSLESGDLTPTLKLKRKVILEKYKDIIEQMYVE
ncbi:MAG: long-chain fatty acid--CoA ligase [Bacteroidota bacterium]